MLEILGRTSCRAGGLGTERGCRGGGPCETYIDREIFKLILIRCKCAYYI